MTRLCNIEIFKQKYNCNINVIDSKITRACGVMVIVVGNGHGDTRSNPGRG